MLHLPGTLLLVRQVMLASFFLLVLLSPKRFPDAGQMVFLFPCIPVFISSFHGALLMSAPTS